MSEKIKFYLDQHVSKAIADGLARRGIDVLTCADADNCGDADLNQLTFTRETGRVFFTQDADFLRIHADGFKHPGIIYVKQGTSTGKIIRGLALIHEVMTPVEMENHIEFL